MMIFDVKSGNPLKQKTPCLIIGVTNNDFKTHPLAELDQLLNGKITAIRKDGDFTGKHLETLLLYPKGLPFQRILLVGLGQKNKLETDRIFQSLGAATTLLMEKKITSAVIDIDSFPVKGGAASAARLAIEGIVLASYRFDRYRTEKREELPVPSERIAFITSNKKDIPTVNEGITEALSVCRGVLLARDLVNEPGNVKSPEYLAEKARSLAVEQGLRCTVLEKKELVEQGFGALLGVAQGSVREPRLITLEYTGSEPTDRPVVLIGKGVVFDAGGISLKPAEKMDEMKMDMGGAAAVLGTLLAASLLKLPVNLVGIIPAVENLPSGTAIRPGDILTSLSGRTIEVVNTDAEGRLILADALTYAERFNPGKVIDLATLTGACIIALGHHATAILGNNSRLIRQLIAAGKETGERLWELPLWEDYASQIKSDIADIKNIGGRPAGTITAAAFLQHFAEKYDWAHLDIAGTAWEETGRPTQPKGGTGVGVRLLVKHLTTHATTKTIKQSK